MRQRRLTPQERRTFLRETLADIGLHAVTGLVIGLNAVSHDQPHGTPDRYAPNERRTQWNVRWLDI